MPLKIDGMTPTGELRVECEKASEALAALGKMRESSKAINCTVRHPSGRLIRDGDLRILASGENQD